MKCLLCEKESKGMPHARVTPDARKWHDQHFPGMNLDEVLAKTGICEDCIALPPAERKKLAKKAIDHEKNEYRRELMEDAVKKRRN